jgi:hypothetical protein
MSVDLERTELFDALGRWFTDHWTLASGAME